MNLKKKKKSMILLIVNYAVVLIPPLFLLMCAGDSLKIEKRPTEWKLERSYSTSLATAEPSGWKSQSSYPTIFVPFQPGDPKNFLLSRDKIFAALPDINVKPEIEITCLPDEGRVSPENISFSKIRAETMETVLVEGGFDPDQILINCSEDSRNIGISEKGGTLLTVLPDTETISYLWNIWAQEAKEQFKPISTLEPQKVYTVNIDLSGIEYILPNIQTFLVSRIFRGLIQSELTIGKESLQLDVVMIPDQRFFRIRSEIIDKLEVNLNDVRNFDPQNTQLSTNNIVEILRREINPTFVFDRLRLEFETKKRQGWGSIGLSFWHEGRPFDELSVDFCVALNDEMCRNHVKSDGVTLAGTELFEVANDSDFNRPDASLHLIEFSDSLIAGVFARNDEGNAAKFKNYKVWTVSNNLDAFRTNLNEIQYNFGIAKKDPVSVGRSLLNLIFPARDKDASSAFHALKSFFNDNKSSEIFPTKRKSLFVRYITNRKGETSLFPFGLINIDGTLEGFLGYHFLINTPLSDQDYSILSCPSSWQTVLPVNSSNSALIDARKRFSSRVEINPFKKEEILFNFTNGKAPVFAFFDDFNRWIDNRGFRNATTLMVVSHHNRNSLYFDQESSILHSKNVSTTFLGPSVAIVIGCSTGKPGAGSLAYAINQAGVQTLIATNTGINGVLAGDFIEMFTKRIGESDKPIEISKIFSKIQRDLYEIKSAREKAYGASVLSFSLAGNPNIKICSP